MGQVTPASPVLIVPQAAAIVFFQLLFGVIGGHAFFGMLWRDRLCKPEVTGSIPVRSTFGSPAHAGFSVATFDAS